MRKITQKTIRAFLSGQSKKIKNTRTDGNAVYLHGNQIIKRTGSGKYDLTLAGWGTVTTRERLNGFLKLIRSPYRFVQRDFEQKLINRENENAHHPINPDSVIHLNTAGGIRVNYNV